MRKLKVRLMQKEGRSSMPKTNSSKKELDMRSDVPGGEIVLYTAADGTVKLDVRLEKETVWLTQQLMAELFQTTKQNIGQHLKSIFQSGELAQKAVVKKFFTTAADGKSYDTNFYNLDAIISVGYRVKSHVAMQFRIWATNVLRDHLLRGYSVNERRLQELNQAIRLIADVANRRELTGDEATALLRVVGEYSFALDLLDDYDYQRVAAPGPGATVIHALDYDEAVRIVGHLRGRFGGSELFGREKDNSLQSALGAVIQTWGGADLYPGVEAKAANLRVLPLILEKLQR